jgi:hypothetical protein
VSDQTDTKTSTLLSEPPQKQQLRSSKKLTLDAEDFDGFEEFMTELEAMPDPIDDTPVEEPRVDTEFDQYNREIFQKRRAQFDTAEAAPFITTDATGQTASRRRTAYATFREDFYTRLSSVFSLWPERLLPEQGRRPA